MTNTNSTNEATVAPAYLLLGRLKSDLEYYLSRRDCKANGSRLWDTPSSMLAKIIELYTQIPTAPEWLTGDDIARLAYAVSIKK